MGVSFGKQKAEPDAADGDLPKSELPHPSVHAKVCR